MGHVEVAHVDHVLNDGRPLLADISFRVGDGAKVALIGPNGAGKTTLLRVVAGDLTPTDGAVASTGGLGVMPQFVGSVRDCRTVRDLLIAIAPPRLRVAAQALESCEVALMEREDDELQVRYAEALCEWSDAGGWEAEVLWDTCTTAALGVPWDRARWREASTLSGGEQKRLVLEALLRGPDDVLLLDEPDNFLDVPGKIWLEERLIASRKTVLFVSHDRQLLASVADRIITLERGAAGVTAWVHGGGYATYDEARRERNSRLEELRRRWDEDHAKLKALVVRMRQKASYNSDMASALQAAASRLERFEAAGPPLAPPPDQRIRMRLAGGRTAKRAVVCQGLELAGLMQPFDLEVCYGERVGVLGSNGSGKSHFLRLLARGGSDPDLEHQPVGSSLAAAPVAHTGLARLGPRVRPGWFAQTHAHPELVGRSLLDILWKGDPHREGMGLEQAARALDRYELAAASDQTFETLSGGQQARLQILLLELSGATLLLLDEPSDNLDLASVEALETGLAAFDGTVIAVTHDRWFARSFDRYLIFRADGRVVETAEPVWDEGRVARVR